MKTIRNKWLAISKQFAFLLFITAVGFTSCSKDEEDNEIINPDNQALGSFELLQLPDGSIDASLTSLFSWTASIDPDGDDVSYDVLMDQSTNPTTVGETIVPAIFYHGEIIPNVMLQEVVITPE